MANSAELRAGSIGLHHLTPEVQARLNKKTGNVATIISNSSTSNNQMIISAICCEKVEPFSACRLGSDGKAYKASIIAANQKPAQFIAITYGEIGQLINFIIFGTIKKVPIGFEVGKTVYLSADTLNISTSIPTFESGKYYQKIGFIYDSTTFLVDVQPAMEIE